MCFLTATVFTLSPFDRLVISLKNLLVLYLKHTNYDSHGTLADPGQLQDSCGRGMRQTILPLGLAPRENICRMARVFFLQGEVRASSSSTGRVRAQSYASFVGNGAQGLILLSYRSGGMCVLLLPAGTDTVGDLPRR